MKDTLTFSGWGQSADSLAYVAPGATCFDYLSCADINEFFNRIKDLSCKNVIGWSLGGQLALRAISEGFLQAEKLVLIASPYQFVADSAIKSGMDSATFASFYINFESEPEKTLKRFATLISQNDANHRDILHHLRKETPPETDNLLYWLEELGDFSCDGIDFSVIPPTLAMHGRDDTIVDITQTNIFKPLIADYKCHIFEKCGHAPHLHDKDRVKKLVVDFFKEGFR